jgi:phage N-6-adenine-methyltransferase
MPKNTSQPAALRKENWETPQWLINELKREFPILLDLAADFSNFVAPMFITEIFSEGTDARLAACREQLKGQWAFINPPYQRNGGTGKFVLRAVELAHRTGMGLIVLVPASVGSKWFHEAIFAHFDHVVFPRRFAFVEPGGDHENIKGSAQFDCALAVGGLPLTQKQTKALKSLGHWFG